MHLQKIWQQQFQQNTATGAQEICLVHQAYKQWVRLFFKKVKPS